MYVYWAEVLTDHSKNCDDFFVVQYFGIVHHTLNRNGTYTGGKRNPLHFVEKSLTDESQHKSLTDESQHKSLTDESQHKSLTDESQHKSLLMNRNTKGIQRLTNQHFPHSKPMQESVTLNVQYTG